MIAIEYVEKIRKAYAEKDFQEIARLEQQYGDQEVTFRELEEVVSFDTESLLGYLFEIDESNNKVLGKLLAILIEKNVLTKEEIESIIDLEEENEETGEGEQYE